MRPVSSRESSHICISSRPANKRMGSRPEYPRQSGVWRLESDSLITWMDLYLSGNPLPVKMSKPPASHVVNRVWSHEGNSEISLVSGGDGLLGSLHCRLPCLFYHGGRSSHLLVKCGILLLISRLPGVVNLQASVELLPAGL